MVVRGKLEVTQDPTMVARWDKGGVQNGDQVAIGGARWHTRRVKFEHPNYNISNSETTFTHHLPLGPQK
jgi:hypothetical protein